MGKNYCYIYYKGPYSTSVHGTIPQVRLDKSLSQIAFEASGFVEIVGWNCNNNLCIEGTFPDDTNAKSFCEEVNQLLI